MKKYCVFILVLFFTGIINSCSVKATSVSQKCQNSENEIEQDSQELIKRILPKYFSSFIIEAVPSDTVDWFEILSREKKIVLRGNNGVSIASALYYYLNHYCHCQITWNGTNLNLPKTLPMVSETVYKKTPYKYRYYLNYCTFNYSMSWWNWDRWEKEIDWMALHGINMPLAITGEEYIWDKVYRSYGFKNEDLDPFFSGPAFFSWFWMGNLDGWGGPLPQSWKISHRDLQKKILKRERELGMKTVLPAFTGHVPKSFKKFFPKAKLKSTSGWNLFDSTYILDAEDPLFAEIGKKFLEVQKQVYGTDHLYSADTFNENDPPSNDPEYLSKLSGKVFQGMKDADPEAIWVMQGWLFYSHRKFWEIPQMKGLLKSVPNDRMIILDLAAEIEPVWKRTDAFYGKQWIWNMLHNFGGNISMFGRIQKVAEEPAKALNDSACGSLKGIGLTMEAIEQNPVIYELMTENTWRNTKIDLKLWLKNYVLNRYGCASSDMMEAWSILENTVYNGKVIRDGAESIIVSRPTFKTTGTWARTKLNYKAYELLPSWDIFIREIPKCMESDGFGYDLTDVTRQVLANYALPLQQKFAKAYKDDDRKSFNKYSAEFIELIEDMDFLLATRKDFLLGTWLSDARRWGENEKEKSLYEQNARDLITLWGETDSNLHEYSNRQWSGLLNDFYKPRWVQFIAKVKRQWKNFDQKAFDNQISQWEWSWVNDHKDFPVKPTGNTIDVVKKIYKKYRERLKNIYVENDENINK